LIKQRDRAVLEELFILPFDAPERKCLTAIGCAMNAAHSSFCGLSTIGVNRWDEKAGLRRDAIRSQVIDALEAQEIKETGNEED